MGVKFDGGLARLMEWTPHSGAVRAFAAGSSTGPFQVAPEPDAIARFGVPSFASVSSAVSFRGVTRAGSAAIFYQEDPGSPARIVCTAGEVLPELPGTVVGTLSDPAGGPDGTAVTWVSRIRGRGITLANDDVLLSADENGVRVVGREGQQAPDCELGTHWRRFAFFAIPRLGGGPVFVAQLRGMSSPHNVGTQQIRFTSANDVGLWAVDAAAQPRLFLREGDQLGPVRVGKFQLFERSHGAPGTARALAAGGNAAVSIIGADGNRHILRVALP